MLGVLQEMGVCMSALKELFSEPYVVDGVFGDGIIQRPENGDSDQPASAIVNPEPAGNVMKLAINSSEVEKLRG